MQNDKSSSGLPVETPSSRVRNFPELKSYTPKTGILHHKEASKLLLCKPKLMPLKSMTLEKIQKMQLDAEKKLSNR